MSAIGATQHPESSLIRKGLLFLVTLGVAGTATELVFLRHWEESLQLIPFVSLGALALALALVVFGGPSAIRIGRWLALAVLVTVFAAVVAAVVPIVMGLFAIAVALGVVALLGQFLEFNLFVENMVSMIGLALGIDYSLFILSRYREERPRGNDKLEAIGRAGATANRAVFFSGITVVLALLVGRLRLSDRTAAIPLTAGAAVAFAPLRLRSQRVVDRLMYGQRDDPYAVLADAGRAPIAPSATPITSP